MITKISATLFREAHIDDPRISFFFIFLMRGIAAFSTWHYHGTSVIANIGRTGDYFTKAGLLPQVGNLNKAYLGVS